MIPAPRPKPPESKAERVIVWSVWAWGAWLTMYHPPARKRWDDLFPEWVRQP